MNNEHTQPEFETWWASQDTDGLSLASKWAAWNAWLAALATIPEGRRAEVRLNDDKTLDEVVTKDGDQLEQMDYNHWFLQIADVAVWLHSKNAIRASYEHRSSAALDAEAKGKL